ncbi:MAG: SEL1-like repeat protein [bacterium]|nr:SEL1-like repeat protein [bacterium]
MLKHLVAGFVAIVMLAGVAVAGPLEDGNAAYEASDYATALQLWRPLAEQGDAEAQLRLGRMYAYGQGVPQDYVEAMKWFQLAAAQGHENAKKYRDLVAEQMTPDQLAEAQRLAREWKPTAER